MIFAYGGDISIAITRPFLKIIGYWVAADRVELSRRNLTVVYTVFAIAVLGVITVVELFYSTDNSSDMLYFTCNLATVSMCLLKLFTILAHRTEFFNLITYLQRKFLQSKYDLYEKAAVDSCKRNCSIYICCFTFFALATCTSYILSAVVANIGKSGSDRKLPLHMFSDIESVTPYFEIFFTLQSAFLMQIGVCYFCFDNILCIICMHASCQFRILQYRLRNLNNTKDKGKRNEICSEKYYAAFRNSVQYHQTLIIFCNKLEEVFTLFALGQVLIFSLLICLDGYQIVSADAPLSRRVTFIFHLMGCIVQLLMFTYGCDCLMRDSADVAPSMYEAPWLHLPMDKYGTMMRKDLLFVIARSRVPCYLSACGFSTISLETYTKSVFLVQMSYFCFDNILCIICQHASCQFRILQYRLRNLNNINDEEKRKGNCSENYYAAFRNSVQYHQALIAFCNKLEEVFNLFALYQVVLSTAVSYFTLLRQHAEIVEDP